MGATTEPTVKGQEQQNVVDKSYYTDLIFQKIEKLGNGSPYLWTTFILCLTPSIMNGYHASSYVFIGQTPDDFWCVIPELKQNTNWTREQIINISTAPPDSRCQIYDHFYPLLAQMSYEDALAAVQLQPKPELVRCGSKHLSYFSYDQEPGISFIQDWNLVCDKTVLRTNVQMALSLGKFIGAVTLGIFADRFGRKTGIVVSCILYMVSGPMSFLTPWYWMFFISRIIMGAAGAGVYHIGYTLLTEITSTKHRDWLSFLYSINYPIGSLVLAGVAYLVRDWRHLQACLTLPAFLLIIHIIYIDESPRWLISKNKLSKAYQIVFKEKNPVLSANEKCFQESKENVESVSEKLKKMFKEISMLYGRSKMRNRLLICQFAWFVSSFSYYVIGLNAENLSANRYVYIAIMGLFELPSCFLPIPLLRLCGRRLTSLILFLASGASLLALFLITDHESNLTTFIVMFGRLCISAAYIVVILHTAELFPTEVRNSSIGTSSTMSHIGSIISPYVVDFLGAIAWFIPTTICAIILICAGALVMLLPETQGKNLNDKVDEIEDSKGQA